MKNYVMMNKEQNRILLESKLDSDVLSGELNYSRFDIGTPMYFYNTFLNRLKAKFKGLVLVEFEMQSKVEHQQGSFLVININNGALYKVLGNKWEGIMPFDANYIDSKGKYICLYKKGYDEIIKGRCIKIPMGVKYNHDKTPIDNYMVFNLK